MSYKNYDIVNHEKFVAQYMDAASHASIFTSDAIQIYPLAIASSLIKPPTNLFRADYNFLLFFSTGGGQQQVDNEIFDLDANDILFIREGHLNAIKYIHPNTHGYFIHIATALLPQIFVNSTLLHRLTFYPKHSVSTADMNWLCKCCELISLSRNENTLSRDVQITLLKAITLKLTEASTTTLSRPDRQSEVAMLFKELLYDNFINNRDVKFYADKLSVSENYLNRCVNYITSKPPKQHINEMVIIHSKLLLQNRAKGIAQVAFELNFSDPAYFGRQFKQLTGQTPTEFRNSFTQDLSGQM